MSTKSKQLTMLPMWAYMLLGVVPVAYASSLSAGDSVTAVFAQRAKQCYSQRGYGLETVDCGHEFTIGASYAIRLLSEPATKSTEDAIKEACTSGCMNAVLSEITQSFRDDTICAASSHARLDGPVMVAVGRAVCAAPDHEGGDSELCFVSVAQLLREKNILDGLVSMDGTFSWPEQYKMSAICGKLQTVGCCAATFQLAATAFFMADCRLHSALQVALLSERCAALGTPISDVECGMAGVDDPQWLRAYNPYTNPSMLADMETFCAAALPESEVEAAKTDDGQGCWADACVLVDGLAYAAKNLGIRRAEAITYIILLAASFSVICGCVCSTCLMSWLMHRLDAKGCKAYMATPDEGAPDPDDDPTENGQFVPPRFSRTSMPN